MPYQYQPYQPTWNNPYMPQSTAPQGYSVTSPLPGTSPIVPPQSVNGVIKVNGRDSAFQYQLPPNSMSPALFDQNGRTFYIVSTDGAGAKTVEAFDFTPHVDEHPLEIDGARFVSREEFDDFAAKVNAVIGAQSNGVHEPIPAAAIPTVPAVPAAPTAAHAKPVKPSVQ